MCIYIISSIYNNVLIQGNGAFHLVVNSVITLLTPLAAITFLGKHGKTPDDASESEEGTTPMIQHYFTKTSYIYIYISIYIYIYS